MEENFATRLKLFMNAKGIASSQFADSCEIPRPSFSQLLSGRNQKVSDILIRKIHSEYPELSIVWLMFGEGSMLTMPMEGREGDGTLKTEGETLNSNKNEIEIENNSTNGKGQDEYSNLTGLTATPESSQIILEQQLESNKRMLELQLQIENLQKNPRKVTHITVYYDDCTFETFVPASSNGRK